jgi:nitrite reductase/ring-hydroxylating ferredoxin subunit
LCVVGYENELFALSAKCPHAGGDLSKGWCKDKKIFCPLHRYSYDLATGRGSPGQNDYVDRFAVDLRPDGVFVGIESFIDKVIKMFK